MNSCLTLVLGLFALCRMQIRSCSFPLISLVLCVKTANISLLQMLFDNFFKMLSLIILIIIFWLWCDVKLVDLLKKLHNFFFGMIG